MAKHAWRKESQQFLLSFMSYDRTNAAWFKHGCLSYLDRFTRHVKSQTHSILLLAIALIALKWLHFNFQPHKLDFSPCWATITFVRNRWQDISGLHQWRQRKGICNDTAGSSAQITGAVCVSNQLSLVLKRFSPRMTAYLWCDGNISDEVWQNSAELLSILS